MRSRVVVSAVIASCAIAVAAAAVVVSPATTASAQTPTAPRRVLVYGDSLTWEAQAGIEQAIEAQLPGWDAVVRAAPGTATCNTLPAMRGADGNLNAGVVVLQYVAVPFGPCMTGKDSLAQHTADTQAAIALWASRGVPVVLVGAPNGVGDPSDFTGTAVVNRDLAASTRQTFVDAGVLLRDPWTGVYQERLPCLDGETAAQGCGPDGLIAVRDATGGHFCAIHNVGPCPVYASGIVRFAAPIADAVVRAARTGTPAAMPGPPPAAPLTASMRALLAGPGEARGSAANRRVADGARLDDTVVPGDFAAQPVPAARETTPVNATLAGPECGALRRALKESATRDSSHAHAEASFAAPGGGATIDQVVHVLADQRRARDVSRAYAARSAARCLEHVVAAPVTVEPARRVGDGSTVFRAPAARPLVVQITRVGRVVTAIASTNAVTPPPPEAVAAVTNAAVDRAEAALFAVPSR